MAAEAKADTTVVTPKSCQVCGKGFFGASVSTLYDACASCKLYVEDYPDVKDQLACARIVFRLTRYGHDDHTGFIRYIKYKVPKNMAKYEEEVDVCVTTREDWNKLPIFAQLNWSVKQFPEEDDKSSITTTATTKT
jgi:hypothetical protein